MMGKSYQIKSLFKLTKQISISVVLVGSLIFSYSKPVQAQDTFEYVEVIAFVSLALVVGSSSIINPGQKNAFNQLMELAIDNTNAAADGFESGDTSREISKNSAANGNLEAAGNMVDPNDDETNRLITDAQIDLKILRQAAIDRLTVGAALCGNEVLDRGEECDISTGQDDCPNGSYCLDCHCEPLR